jgi:flagellar protein FliS
MNTYFEQIILSASPMELIRILYRQGDTAVRNAREHLKGGRIAERAECINNAYEILTELMAALRPAEAPEIAGRLSSLYTYMQRRLLEANFTQKDEPLEEVLELLTVLASAWEAAPEAEQKAEQKAEHRANQASTSNRWSLGGMDGDPMGACAVTA